MMAIHTGLHLSSITRLRGTWKNVSQKSILRLKEMEDMMDASSGFKNHKKMAASSAPLIPFQAAFLHEIGNPLSSPLQHPQIDTHAHFLSSLSPS